MGHFRNSLTFTVIGVQVKHHCLFSKQCLEMNHSQSVFRSDEILATSSEHIFTDNLSTASLYE